MIPSCRKGHLQKKHRRLKEAKCFKLPKVKNSNSEEKYLLNEKIRLTLKIATISCNSYQCVLRSICNPPPLFTKKKIIIKKMLQIVQSRKPTLFMYMSSNRKNNHKNLKQNEKVATFVSIHLSALEVLRNKNANTCTSTRRTEKVRKSRQLIINTKKHALIV